LSISDILELWGRDVDIKPSYDVWSCGISLLTIADLAENNGDAVPSLYVSEYIPTPEDPSEIMEVRKPVWANIEANEAVADYVDIFKYILTDESSRLSADEIVSVVVGRE
jgi:hypothetical protein